jgi:hypothetical protein
MIQARGTQDIKPEEKNDPTRQHSLIEVVMFKAVITLFSTLLILQGCADVSVKQDKPPNVTSNPSGAAVFVNGLEIGKTPLHANLYDEFPAGWKNSIYQAQGVLQVKMDGCKDFVLKVSDSILSKPIHAELTCGEASQSKKPIAAAASMTSKKSSNTEKRLGELDEIYKKGIITQEEYQKTRARILSEL